MSKKTYINYINNFIYGHPYNWHRNKNKFKFSPRTYAKKVITTEFFKG